MASEFQAIDFHEYHRSELPELLKDGRGADAARSAEPLGSLAFRLSESGDAYTYEARDIADAVGSIDCLPAATAGRIRPGYRNEIEMRSCPRMTREVCCFD